MKLVGGVKRAVNLTKWFILLNDCIEPILTDAALGMDGRYQFRSISNFSPAVAKNTPNVAWIYRRALL